MTSSRRLKVRRTINILAEDESWLVREAARREMGVSEVMRDLLTFYQSDFGLPSILLEALQNAAKKKGKPLQQFVADFVLLHASELFAAKRK